MTSPRKRPVQERSHATVEAILLAASQVLVDQGYAKLTTTQVAERAGVSVGTLYQYYASKDALVYAIAELHFARVTGAVLAAMRESSGSALESRVAALLEALLASKAEEGALGNALHTALIELGAENLFRKNLAAFQRLVLAVLTEHREEIAAQDLELCAFVTVRAVEGVMSALVLESPRKLRDPVIRSALVRLVLGYLDGPRRR